MPPQFTIRPESEYRVMRGSDLEVTCVAVGSPMPHVKWRKVRFEIEKIDTCLDFQKHNLQRAPRM